MATEEIPTMAKHGKASKRASARPRGRPRKRADAANHHPRAEAPRNTESPSPGVAPASAAVTIRFYCQGIGDCHLIRFARPDGYFWVLIDCGIHSSVTNGTETINAVVDDILSITKRLDVIVLTHEHWDHNSGFYLAQEKFRQFEVGEVWAAWTENPKDPQACEFDTFKSTALKALQSATEQMDNARGLNPHLTSVRNGLKALLNFNFGAKGEKVRTAREAFIKLGKGHVKYLEPKTAPFELAIDTGYHVPNVRVYILGPPRDAALLKILERPGELYGLAAGGALAVGLNNARLGPDDTAAPFDSVDGLPLTAFTVKRAQTRSPRVARSEQASARTRTATLMRECYVGRAAQQWRRIDNDWLGTSADLAIQLDKRTNNSSLVLAFELLDTKRVLLFIGDAQVGNWLSWKDVQWKVGNMTVAAHDLLARTVLYKVGHHGSHNATLKRNGLELMTSPDLSAFIPTNAKNALDVGWGEMPFEPLLEDLERRAEARVIRADDPWVKKPGGKPPAKMISGAIKAVRRDPSERGLWVELDVG
jgi:beta-lactamase superfamily II metal-dependent hydrolase